MIMNKTTMTHETIDLYEFWEGLMSDPVLDQIMNDPEDFTEFERLYDMGLIQEALGATYGEC